jgi:hypothetical protein
MLDKLKCIAKQIVSRDPATWAQYGLQPLAIVNGPESPFAALFMDEIAANLDFVIEQLSGAGCWKPNWTWGDLWPDAWAQAEKDWRGVMTFNNLRTLRAFGRLA